MTTRRQLLFSLILFPLLLWGCSKKPDPSAGKAAPSASGAAAKPAVKQTAPLKIAYSDWPGWVAWEIGIQKGWFKEEGVEVDFKWFEYVPSMDAFSAGKVDAVAVTNGDALVTGSTGAPSVGILINDYSNGNDMVVARSGIEKPADLKGKKVGVEVGFVSHLLLMNALKSANLTDKDIEITNVPTDQTPQLLKSGKVDAVVAWQPNSGQALKEVADSKPIFTSADVPGIIYDLLVVNPKSLKENREAWKKVVKVWFRIADYVLDEKNMDDALKIMSARVGLKPEEYKALMKGTFFLNADGNKKHFAKGEELTSLYGSSKTVDAFNVDNKVYKKNMPIEEYFDPSLVEEVMKEMKK